ncbi:MAG TPA: rhodanese-like domain-containing protein [Gemmatimonadaceae bacterium]
MKQHSPGFLKIVDEARPRVRELTVDEARAAVKRGARLIDVREDNEWDESHAKGAEHIGKGIIERDIEKLAPDPNAELILYCGGGFRAVLAADSLQKMGYSNVKSVAGGWRAWQEAGAPVESGEEK